MSAKTLLARDPSLLSEAQFSSLVAETARIAGWKGYHTFDARRSNKGFPDWVFVRDRRLLFVELKSEKGQLRPEQEEWIAALARVWPGVSVFIWRPRDWDQVVEVLTGRRPK